MAVITPDATTTPGTVEHDGLIFPIPVLSPDEARRYRQACDRLEEALGGKPRTVEVRQMHIYFPWAYELATHPRILDAVAAVLGRDLLIWATELFAKHPQDPSVSVAWHRDMDYMGFDSLAAITAWVALSPCDERNGCLMAIPGPERRRAQPPAGVAALGPEMLARHGISCVTLRPGEMSLHDSEILHGSGPNLSREKRVGFAVRFVAPSVRPRHGRPDVVLARGEDHFGHFNIVAPPRAMSEEAALRCMRQAADKHFDNILQNLGDKRTGKA